MRLSENLALTLLLLLLLMCVTALAAEPSWPLKGSIDISNGFGNFRDGRFHAGVDLRTGGVTGLPACSPVDGYVYRFKTSYVGYGKGLYIKGDDGCLYVLAHLSSYSPAIDTDVKRAQFAAKRYAVDITLPPDSLRVKKGAEVARTGQTGTPAPHLHFEKRIADENPVNPLTHGFVVTDKVPPVFDRIGFQQVDDHSLFSNGQRSWYLRVRAAKGAGKYSLDSVPFFTAPFGILVDGSDKIRKDGMEQAIVALSLEIDGRPIYDSRFDTLAFSTGKSVYYEYDYYQAEQGRQYTRRLFHQSPNQYNGSKGLGGSTGVIDIAQLADGFHSGRITAVDSYGNTSVLDFSFVTVKSGPIMRTDSVRYVGQDTTYMYFTPTPAYSALGVDSVKIESNFLDKWLVPANLHLQRMSGETRMIRMLANSSRTAVMCFSYHTKRGGWILDEPFNGLIDQGVKKVDLSEEIVDDGIIVTVKTTGSMASNGRIEVHTSSGMAGRAWPARYFDMLTYRYFIPVREEYARIDSLVAIMDTVTSATSASSGTLRGPFTAIGYRQADTLALDSLFRVVVEKSDLFEPRFVELQKMNILGRGKYRLVTDAYKLLPEKFPSNDKLELQMILNVPNSKNDYAGICRFDFEKNEWNWCADNHSEHNMVTAAVPYGGTFAVKIDAYPPLITGLSIKPRQTLYNPKPTAVFAVADSLSGIGDDTAFELRLDNNWMIPEFNPYTGLCQFDVPEPLANGDHHLAIKIKDRAGNLAEQYVTFTVSAPSEKKRK